MILNIVGLHKRIGQVTIELQFNREATQDGI